MELDQCLFPVRGGFELVPRYNHLCTTAGTFELRLIFSSLAWQQYLAKFKPESCSKAWTHASCSSCSKVTKKTISRNDNYPFRREDIQAANPFGSPSNPFGSPESGESLGEGNPFASSPQAHKAPGKGKMEMASFLQPT